MGRAALLAGAWIAVCAAASSQAQQVLYKWTDSSGKTQYSDRPPKDFKGEVTRIETDVQPATVVLPKKADSVSVKNDGAVRETPSDNAAKKRALRAELELGVARARENLEAARKALAESSDPGPDEVQVIQNRGDNNGGRVSTKVGRANCRQVTPRKTPRSAGLIPSSVLQAHRAIEEAVRRPRRTSPPRSTPTGAAWISLAPPRRVPSADTPELPRLRGPGSLSAAARRSSRRCRCTGAGAEETWRRAPRRGRRLLAQHRVRAAPGHRRRAKASRSIASRHGDEHGDDRPGKNRGSRTFSSSAPSARTQ